MKKIILSALLLAASFNAKAQSTIFEDSFESYTPFAIANVGAWTLTDVDLGQHGYYSLFTNGSNTIFEHPNRGGLKSFQVFDAALTEPSMVTFGLPANSFTARTGNKSMVSFGPLGTIGQQAPVSNNWLISPKITLGTTNVVKFWAKASTSYSFGTPPVEEGFKERFSVYVSSTNTAIASFVKISTGVPVGADYITMAGPGKVWYEYSFILPASYDNTPIYVGIQCVTSNDEGSFLIDDFKVIGTVACPAPSVGSAVVNAFGSSATLNWTTASTSTAYEVKVQLDGAGTPALANNTGVAVSGSATYTASSLVANTNYEFWVREECTDGVLFSAWSGPFLFNTIIDAPNCVTLVAPASGATAIPAFSTVALSWTAASTGTTPTSYDVYFGGTAATMTLLRNVTVITTNAPSIAASSTYYWKVVAKNSVGDAVGCTSVFSFTTGANPFLPYCGPILFGNLEPITSVQFAGISKTFPNTATNSVGGQPSPTSHKILTDVASVAQGGTYPIVLKGNTNSPAGGQQYTNKFSVFIDWNQDGDFVDADELYFGTAATAISIIGSTGLDAISATGNIVVPATAKLGNTRMRIKKQYVFPNAPFAIPLPCETLGYGETHDYTVTVSPNLATDTFDNAKFTSFPNPVKDDLNLSYDKNITNISVINLLGQEVLSVKINSNDAKIDMSTLKSGIYMVKVFTENQEKTIKVIKE